MAGKQITNMEGIEALILNVRGLRVMLDSDLAKVYGVELKQLNQAVRRNAVRFPKTFAFQLTAHLHAGFFISANRLPWRRHGFSRGSQQRCSPI